MLKPIMSLRDRAQFHNRQLPAAIRRYLNEIGIPDALVDRYSLGWNGKAITIPIEDRTGAVVLLKLAKGPFDSSKLPAMEPAAEAPAELFGWKSLLRQPRRIVVVGNEFDCLMLEARGFLAVCSTGEKGSFAAEWVKHFEGIKDVYVCFGRDAASERAAEKIASWLLGATLVNLPEEVGPSGTASDFFLTLGKSQADFEKLLTAADLRDSFAVAAFTTPPAHLVKHADELMKVVPIAKVIGEYIPLRISRKRLVGWCIWHEGKKPTLKVDVRKNSFHCSDCGEGGDAVRFLRLHGSLTFAQAVEQLERIRYEDAA
jgi:hypothetical protein